VNLPDCGAFEVNFASATSTFFVPRHPVWKGEQISATEVRIHVHLGRQLAIVKTFTVMPEKYLVRMSVQVTVHVPRWHRGEAAARGQRV